MCLKMAFIFAHNYMLQLNNEQIPSFVLIPKLAMATICKQSMHMIIIITFEQGQELSASFH